MNRKANVFLAIGVIGIVIITGIMVFQFVQQQDDRQNAIKATKYSLNYDTCSLSSRGDPSFSQKYASIDECAKQLSGIK